MRKLLAFAVPLIAFGMFVIGTKPPAASPPSGARTMAGRGTKWTVDDAIMTEQAGQFRISPDNKWVAWVKQTPDVEKDETISNLFLSSLTEKKEVQLTRGSENNSNPKWSPDGRLVAFISDRPLSQAKQGKPAGEPPPRQLWLINPFGGEPWPLTRSERSVKDFDWVDSETILIATEEDPSLYERTMKEKKDDSRVVEDAAHTPPVRLFKINVKSQEIVRLTTNKDWIQSLAASPDGRKVVVVHTGSLSYEFDEKVKPVTYLYDVETGKGKQIFVDSKIIPFQIRWTLDSRGFYAVSPYSTHPVYRQAVVHQLYYYDVTGDETVKVDLGWENELGLETSSPLAITRDGFIALLAAGSRYKPARYTREGEQWKRAWIQGNHANNISSIELGKDSQTLIYNMSTASLPEQLFRATLDGATLATPQRLTALNPRLDNKTMAKAEVIRWQGALDEEVEGILYFPHNYDPGKKYPLVVLIHGGPLGVDMDRWEEYGVYPYPANLLCQWGAFVLRPNYHGSGNYGLRWAESIGGGRYYELEVPDIEKGVDHLIAQGLVNPDGLGAMGWSNGSILTIALTVNSTRYKVASAGAGDVEQFSDWANSDFGAAFDNYYFGKAPIEDPQLYIRKSPVFQFRKVRTPTLIFSGTEDRAVGPAQAWTHFRTLQQLGQTDVRFVIFPGEPHIPRKLSHQRRKVEEDLAWFDQYLFKTNPPGNEAFKEDSPLGAELKRRKTKKVGLQYGVLAKSTLIPEVVPHEGMELGRFEVTRAQYAAFDRNYRIEPGTENYPANGVTFENALAYCAWLSKLAGETYRLGTKAELEPIYKKGQESENTLDYWAGYRLNPEDAARLQSKIEDLKGEAPLLREVGSFKAAGEDESVFDLGGNVAEWCVDHHGKGKLLGGSADRPADPKTRELSPAPAYIGFRVVRGAAKAAEKK